jgi:hypothetical protein
MTVTSGVPDAQVGRSEDRIGRIPKLIVRIRFSSRSTAKAQVSGHAGHAVCRADGQMISTGH